MLIPAVADGEEDAGVVAGVVVAEAGVGVVDDVHLEIHGAPGTDEPVHAAANLRGEIDGGSVWRRDVGGGEEDAAGNVQVGDDRARLGEVPLQDDGLDAGAVHRAVGREHGINRHDLHRVFKVAANRRAGEQIGGKDQAAATSGKKKLCVGGFAGAGTAAEEKAEFPRAAAIGQRVGRLR